MADENYGGRYTLCHPMYTWAKLPLPISAPTTKSPMWGLLYCLSRPDDETCRGSAMMFVESSRWGRGVDERRAEEQPEGLFYSKDVGGGRIHVHDNARVVYSRGSEDDTTFGTKEGGGAAAWGRDVSGWR